MFDQNASNQKQATIMCFAQSHFVPLILPFCPPSAKILKETLTVNFIDSKNMPYN